MATIYKSVQVEGIPEKMQKDLDALTDDGWTYTDMHPLSFCQEPLQRVGPRADRDVDSLRRTNECFLLIMQKTV